MGIRSDKAYDLLTVFNSYIKRFPLLVYID